jgi:hypothetical protein
MITKGPYYAETKKICRNCCENKDLFPVIKGKEKKICKSCYINLYGDIYENDKKQREKHKERLKQIKEQNINFVFTLLKEIGCQRCGNKDYRVLEFDHRFREIKNNNISHIISNGTLEQLKEEIVKCDILCANCHKIKTHQENNSWKYKFFLKEKNGSL